MNRPKPPRNVFARSVLRRGPLASLALATALLLPPAAPFGCQAEQEPPAATSPAPSGPAAKPRARGDSRTARPKAADRRPLRDNSTLADWTAATAAERSRLAVAMARKRLGEGAEKIDVATMAMEITGCLSATAKDSRLGEWAIAAAAETCLTAPELPAR